MMSAYVKYVQAQGARVVPIIYGEPEEVTLEKLKHLDGVLFPGGDGDYYKLGKLVFDQIIKYYPRQSVVGSVLRLKLKMPRSISDMERGMLYCFIDFC